MMFKEKIIRVLFVIIVLFIFLPSITANYAGSENFNIYFVIKPAVEYNTSNTSIHTIFNTPVGTKGKVYQGYLIRPYVKPSEGSGGNVIPKYFDIKDVKVIDNTLNKLKISFTLVNNDIIDRDMIVSWELRKFDDNTILDFGTETVLINAQNTRKHYIEPYTTFVGRVYIYINGHYNNVDEAEAKKTFYTTRQNKTISVNINTDKLVYLPTDIIKINIQINNKDNITETNATLITNMSNDKHVMFTQTDIINKIPHGKYNTSRTVRFTNASTGIYNLEVMYFSEHQGNVSTNRTILILPVTQSFLLLISTIIVMMTFIFFVRLFMKKKGKGTNV